MAFVPDLPGSQSAIESLLQSLTQPPQLPQGGGLPASGGPPAPAAPGPVNIGGISAPAPQAAPMPQVVAPPQPRLIDRVRGFFDDRFGPKTPGGYGGLLSSQEMEGARPSWADSTAHGSLDEQYQSRLDHILELKQYAQGLSDQQVARQRAAAVQSVRQQAGQMFAAKPNETPQQSAQRLMQHGMYLMGQGDEEGGSKMLNAVGQLSKVLEGPTPKDFEPKPYVDAKGGAIWVKPGEAIPAGAKPLTQANTIIRTDASQGNANTARQDRLVKLFETTTKPLRDRAAMIQQALTTVDRAKNSPDPNERHALYSSAIANFVQAADQKAQLRYQLLNYFKENINASAEGRWNLLKDRVLKGELPDATMEGMLTHLNTLKDLTHSEIEAQRAGMVKRYSKLGLDDALPETDEYFVGADSPAGAPSGKDGADLYSKYGLSPKKP